MITNDSSPAAVCDPAAFSPDSVLVPGRAFSFGATGPPSVGGMSGHARRRRISSLCAAAFSGSLGGMNVMLMFED